MHLLGRAIYTLREHFDRAQQPPQGDKQKCLAEALEA